LVITSKRKKTKVKILNILGPQAPQHESMSEYTRGVAKRGSLLAVDGAAWGHIDGR
jgi:hypothetical protein